jgi:hypothetical protein
MYVCMYVCMYVGMDGWIYFFTCSIYEYLEYMLS